MAADMSRTLVVSNDFPPRSGGIESFVYSVCERLPASEVVVYTAAMTGGAEFDAALEYPVVRDSATTLLPTPGLAQRVVEVFTAHGCDSVLFGAAAPLGLLARPLRRVGARRIVGMTHGHETGWARLPGARAAMRRIASQTDTLTYVSEFCRRRIAPALPAGAAARMVRVAGGVDTDTFRPDVGGDDVRAQLGIDPERPVLLSVSRFVPRKGQDTLVGAMPEILRTVPDAVLLLVGDGPYRRRLESMAESAGVTDSVVFGGAVSWEHAPAWYHAGDVFAMPCRTRMGGLEPEALGIVFLEAQSSGLPVIVGDSGGAPETVQHGRTGFVVDPNSPQSVAERAVELLSDLPTAAKMGSAGHDWVGENWNWQRSVDTLRGLLGVA